MKTVKLLFIIFSIVYLGYLALPSPDFPTPLPGILQSTEPADTETPLRRSYFTDLSRAEVLKHYQDELECNTWCKLPFLTYRLNYPPEEAYAIIRDQTRSTFLEEIVHPFRESVFINGFEPKNDKDIIFVEGKRWKQKITVKWVPTSITARMITGVLTLFSICLIYLGWVKVFTIGRRKLGW